MTICPLYAFISRDFHTLIRVGGTINPHWDRSSQAQKYSSVTGLILELCKRLRVAGNSSTLPWNGLDRTLHFIRLPANLWMMVKMNENEMK